MKRTLLTGLMATTLVFGQVPNPSHATPKLISMETESAGIESVFGRSSKPVKETFVVEQFNYMYPDGILPRSAQIVEEAAKRHKAYMEEKAKQEEEERIRMEEQRIENERRDNVTFNDMDVTQKSGITSAELESVLYSTTSGSGLAPYASYFVEAEEMYSINALFLCALAAEESGWGKYAGGNGTNITGYAVYTSSHTGTTFDGGIRDNILSTAKLISENYTAPDGRYRTVWQGYNEGKSIYEVNQRYCLMQDQVTVDNRWAQKISKIANGLADKYHTVVK